MNEIFPGAFHWKAMHAPIGVRVSSYFLSEAGIVIDPKLPDHSLAAIPGEPNAVVLTSGHHGRDSAIFAEHYRIPIRSLPEAAERLAGTLEVEPVRDGEQAAPGVQMIHIGILCDDEGALWIKTDGGSALCIADGLTSRGGELGFFDDELLGDDPAAVKEGLKRAYGALLHMDFDHLLFAHGDPVIGVGKSALRAFTEDR